MRLFIGLPLTPEAERGVEKVVEKLLKKRWKVRWEPREKWHLTLVFLGDQPVEEIMPILDKIDAVPFSLRFKGLGRFPEIKRAVRVGERVRGRNVKRIRLLPKDTIVLPKIIYMDLKGDLQALFRLQRKIVFEKMPFKPHVTIGKIQTNCSRGEKLEIAKEIEKLRVMELTHEWLVDRVCLYESTLRPEGSVYKVIDEVKLNE